MNMNAISWLGGCALLVAASGCGPQTVELEHDTGGAGGAPASAGATPAGSGAATTHGGSSATGSGGNARGGSEATDPGSAVDSQPGDACEESCSEGFECFRSQPGQTGVCAPLCGDPFDQSLWGQPCERSLAGGAGVCRPMMQLYTEDPSGLPGISHSGVGVCTVACSPLRQDCPQGFSCSVTEDRADAMPDRVFACLPITEPEPFTEGESCGGWPMGECARGLACTNGASDESSVQRCYAFCDSEDDAACGAGQTCEVPYWFPPATTVGICSPVN
jgi:hypothetical protein